MTKYTIEIEIEDHDIWSALEWEINPNNVSSGTYMDVKDKLFDALKKQIDKYELDMEVCGALMDVDEQINWIDEMGYEVEKFLEDMGYEDVEAMVKDH